jgi:cyclophilin family peptidyl-prolyl cis-trans isomerase
MIQGGDPSGNGSGGPGYNVPAEISPTLKHTPGMVATARQGDQVNPKKESSGSQFYIVVKDSPFLDGNYTIFGQVIAGMENAYKIEKTPLSNPQMGVPKDKVYILNAKILKEGKKETPKAETKDAK